MGSTTTTEPDLRLVGVRRRRQLPLRDELDPLIDRQEDVVPGQRLLVLDALREDQAARPVAQTTDLLDVAPQLIVERELDAILALSAGRDEAEHRATPTPGSGSTAAPRLPPSDPRAWPVRPRPSARIASTCSRRHPTLEPREAPSPRELVPHPLRLHRQGLADALGRLVQERGERLRSLTRRSISKASTETLGTSTLTASGGAVAVVDRAALGGDVQTALPLLLRELTPLVAPLDLDSERSADDHAQTRGPSGRRGCPSGHGSIGHGGDRGSA